ncbi:MAG: RNA methyltransferase [Actinobacteria bacterium]|nr:RNA methyltransferase [Actinomycetota bacterium]MBO0786850.1 RNA methyltransferase [Actinomycetota bacterium]
MTDPAGHELTSTRSPRVKAARQLAKRALRQRSRLFLAEGPQAVAQALTVPGVVRQVFLTAPARARHPGLVAGALAQGADVQAVSGEVMAELAQTITPQGVLAVCGFVDVPLPELARAGHRLVAVLANVRDPGNAGTVLRTADAAGADGVIFAGASVDPYNSKCVRASAGSLFHLPVVAGAAVPDAVEALRAGGLAVLAADGRTGRPLPSLAARGVLAGPTAWLFGNEAWGLPPDVLALADETVAVPIYGRAESLNLAVAAAVCLYASAGAHRQPGTPAAAAGKAERAARPPAR